MPVSLEIAKKHCRVDGDYDDDLIALYLSAATAWVETHTSSSFTQKQVTELFPRFGSELVLKNWPVVSVDAVRYLDVNGVEQTFDDHRIYRGNRIITQAGHVWPQTIDRSDVEVVVTVGFNAEDIPAELKQAVLLLTGHQYENREAVVIGTISSELPMGVQSLVGPFRPVEV